MIPSAQRVFLLAKELKHSIDKKKKEKLLKTTGGKNERGKKISRNYTASDYCF